MERLLEHKKLLAGIILLTSLLALDQRAWAMPFYFSISNSGNNTLGSLTGVRNQDVVFYNGSDYTMFFDGSDVGFTGNLDALHLLSKNSFLFSFSNNGLTLPGVGAVDDSDILRFTATSTGDTTAGTFSLFFKGADNGLTTDSEDIDALSFLRDGRMLISTLGSYSVPGVSGNDEDILAFTPIAPGDYSSGTWELYFDGSDVGLTADVEGLGITASGKMLFTTTGNFSVPGLSGTNADIFAFEPASLGSNTTGTFPASLVYDGSENGTGSIRINALHPIPEPSTLLLLGGGLLALAGLARQRR